MVTGNKGEWSEIYVFLKLLADGRLNAADANLNAIPNVYYPIIKILRQENTISREYRINGNIKIVDGNNNELLNLPIAEFVSRSQQLFNELRNVEGRSFAFADIETFLNAIPNVYYPIIKILRQENTLKNRQSRHQSCSSRFEYRNATETWFQH